MVMNRLRVLLVGALVAAGLMMGMQPASAFTAGQVWAYNDSNYGGGLAVTYQMGNVDCQSYWQQGLTFWTNNGTGPGGVISSVNVNVGNRVNCNMLGVKSNSTQEWFIQCISHTNGGIAGFPSPWNDNLVYVAVWNYSGCPRY